MRRIQSVDFKLKCFDRKYVSPYRIIKNFKLNIGGFFFFYATNFVILKEKHDIREGVI